jgi:hypothetical protein
MPAPFTPRLDILAAPQRRLRAEFGALPAESVPDGGTALALRLGHRRSDDFGFFIRRPLDPLRLMPALPFLAGATVVRRTVLGVLARDDGPHAPAAAAAAADRAGRAAISPPAGSRRRRAGGTPGRPGWW